MNFPLLVARRYLFSKRSTNAIHIITGISVVGLAVGTAALILVLSVFNGFEDLLGGLFGYFNPELKITPTKGKTFVVDSAKMAELRALPGLQVVSETLEEVAFFEYEGSQDFGVLKGVDAQFSQVNGIDSTIREGEYSFTRPGNEEETQVQCAVLGAGMRNKLSVNVHSPLAALTIYMPTAKETSALDKPFKTRTAYPAGTFAIQQDFDNQYVLVDLDFARELLDAPDGTVSSLEIRLRAGANLAEAKSAVRQFFPASEFTLKDRYEQNEAFFKVLNLEKWMGYAISSLMLLLLAFNLVGALWMVVLDKQKDISILKSLGARDAAVRRIFLTEGLLLTCVGMALGFALGIGLYAGQKHFGWVSIPEGFLVSSYPVAMRASDFLPVTLTVLAIGLLASVLPARRAGRVPAFLREE